MFPNNVKDVIFNNAKCGDFRQHVPVLNKRCVDTNVTSGHVQSDLLLIKHQGFGLISIFCPLFPRHW